MRFSSLRTFANRRSPRRARRNFIPDGLNHGFGELEKRLPPSTWVDVSFSAYSTSEYNPFYRPPLNNPTAPEVLYFYGETKATTEIASPASPQFDSSDPTTQTASLELTAVQGVSISVSNSQTFTGEVFIASDDILLWSAETYVEQHWDYSYWDVAPGLPPSGPVTIAGNFSVSLGYTAGIFNDGGIASLSFQNDFANVQVNGDFYSANWSYAGTSYSASGDLRDGPFSLEYSGVDSDGVFSTDASGVLHPLMRVGTSDPSESAAALNWSYTTNFVI